MTSATTEGRWKGIAAEAAVSIGTAALFTLSCYRIRVNPMDRVGQVSGLASLGFRFVIATLLILGLLALASRWRNGAKFPLASKLACAAFAGLASGFVAGGIVVALRGTMWGLNGLLGDAGDLILWSKHHDKILPTYPPLSVYIFDWYTAIFDVPGKFALKHLQIIGTLLMGPATYLSWRLVMSPRWALGIGVVASLPLLESAPYKPYGNAVLIVLIPIVIRFIDELRRTPERSHVQNARIGGLFGVCTALMCLMYSGWFQWAAPGCAIAFLVAFPWRNQPRRAVVFLGAAAVAFMLVAGRYLITSLAAGALPDNFMYFDTKIDPAYIAMYRGDLPGKLDTYPPLGELGGVGVFTILMAAGLGVAVALNRGRSAVLALGSIIGGAWLLRFYYAHSMWETKLVQLYPRTTPVILYCMLVMCGYAIYYIVERHHDQSPTSKIHGSSGTLGALAAIAIILGSSASSIANAYMPLEAWPWSPGRLSWIAHNPEIFGWGKKKE